MQDLVSALEKPRLSVVNGLSAKRLRVLLVDSDSAEVLAVRREFEVCRSARLEVVHDAEMAMQAMASRHYDLVAVDPALPGGFGLLKSIKYTYRWTATLVVTASDAEVLRQAVQFRIDGLLFKPVLPVEFVEQALLLAGGIRARRHAQQKRVLAIGAHPDDIEIGCGGTLAKHGVHGDLLRILTLTRGAAGGDVNQRVIEAQKAANVLGAVLEMGNLPDTRVGAGVETIEVIEAVIREFRPTDVYTHCSEDTHQDHRAVHAATLVAARGVANVYCYQTPSTTVDFRPNRFVDITDFMRQKQRAIDKYESQVERMGALHHDLIQATARYWGRYADYVLAEPLQVVRQRDGDIPLVVREGSAANSASPVD